jgi:polar amino acid transport system permease protein
VRVLSEIATFYTEVVRGIPILVFLFYIAFVGAPMIVGAVNWLLTPAIVNELMAPLTVRNFDFTWRAIVALMVCYSAFLAEIFRAGIEAVDQGQVEAAKALGFTRWQIFRLVVAPQALRIVLPPIVSLCIAFFLNPSLVMIIGIFDLLNAAKRSVGEPAWQGFGPEAYLFVAAIYFSFCFAMSRYGQRLEKRLDNKR